MFTKFFNPKTCNTWKNTLFYSTNQFPFQLPSLQVLTFNTTITQLFKNGDLQSARKVFDEMRYRTVVSYNTMISGYSNWNKLEEALGIVSIMNRSNTMLNETTFTSVLSVCARLRRLLNGQEIHTLVIKTGSEEFELVGSGVLNLYSSCREIGDARKVFDLLCGKNRMLWSFMLVGYVRCGLMREAENLFRRMRCRGVVAWTAMISGYSRERNENEKALEIYKWMRSSGEVKPNEFTFDSVLRAICKLGDLKEGRIIHGLCIRYGFEFEHCVSGALIELYCNCGKLEDAELVYEKLTSPHVKSSNSLIEGCILSGKMEKAEIIFDQLDNKNTITYNMMIKGYAMIGRVEHSKRLFEEMPERTLITSNTMISVYCRNRKLDEAMKLFEETKWERNTVTWNSMISGYTLDEQPEKAIHLYVEMQWLPVERNRSTFSTLFHACSCIGSLQQGRQLHGHAIKASFESNVYVGTSLVDMYSKCGNITDAKTSFLEISSPNVAAWTSLINGYAHQGLGTEAILLFFQMLEQGVCPNAVTFVGILLACGHAGLVNEGMKFFYSMYDYGVVPTLEHYTCVVDLLCRSGCLQKALRFINNMTIEADGILWGALLSACWHWMDMEVGEKVAEKLFLMDPKIMACYVIMSNIYAALGKWEEVAKVRKKLRSLEVKKGPGCSWIEVNNACHVFCVEDRTHPQCDRIYTILEDLTANINFSFEIDFFVFEYE
ncbi:hypothetical protein ACHQM5_011807 [Ranunculus cassubicifolius]